MINSTITPDQIRVFRVKVARDLLDIINDSQGSFTLDSYIKNIYDVVEKATGNKSLATEYAKIAPIMLGQLMIKPDLMSIRKKGLSGDAVLDLIERYSDPDKGLDYTVEDLGLNEPLPDVASEPAESPLYLFFDTETNGKALDFNAPVDDLDNWPRIAQLGWQVYNVSHELISEGSYLIKPDGWEIPQEQFFIDNNMSTERCEEFGIPIS